MHKEYIQFTKEHSEGLEAFRKLRELEWKKNEMNQRDQRILNVNWRMPMASRIPREMMEVGLLRAQVEKFVYEASELSVPDLDDPTFWISLIDQLGESSKMMISTGWTLAVLDGQEGAKRIAFQPRVMETSVGTSVTLAYPSIHFPDAFAAIPVSELRTYGRRLQKIEPMILNCMSGKAPYDAYGVRPGGEHGHVLKNIPRGNTQAILESSRRLNTGNELELEELLDGQHPSLFA